MTSPLLAKRSSDLPDWLREYEKVEPASRQTWHHVFYRSCHWFADAAITTLRARWNADLNAASTAAERLPGVGLSCSKYCFIPGALRTVFQP
jgi:hypothetical protein